MKTRSDWAAWLSMAAIAAVCAGIVLVAAPEPPEASEREAAPAGPTGANAPVKSFELDQAVDEISGLSMASDGKSLWAVDDEKPTLFRLSVEDGSIVQKLDLGKRGDYESVEEIGDRVYVTRSDGVILVVDPAGGAQTEKLTFTKDVGVACDIEGTAYQPSNERLLITCKNEGLKTRKSNRAFEVWAMDLKTRQVGKEPALVIEEQALDEQGVKGKSFAPSGLAVHPKTGELYFLSSRGKLLVVTAPDGKVLRAERLDGQLHRQPEGIAFANDGTMYLSDEAHGAKAMLYVFKE